MQNTKRPPALPGPAKPGAARSRSGPCAAPGLAGPGRGRSVFCIYVVFLYILDIFGYIFADNNLRGLFSYCFFEFFFIKLM